MKLTHLLYNFLPNSHWMHSYKLCSVPPNGLNFPFQLVNGYKSPLYSISFQIPAHSTPFYPFQLIPLNFTQYGDFRQYVNKSFFSLNPFFLITSLFVFEKLLLLHLHLAFYYYFILTMCFSYLLFPRMTFFSSLIYSYMTWYILILCNDDIK